MQQFVYLFIGSSDLSELSPEETQRHVGRWYAWIREMREAGVYRAGHPLQSEGKTVHGPGKQVTDDPFAETKELVGGYILVEVGNLEAAVELAKGCPTYATGGRVEIRPVAPLGLDD